MFLLNQNITFHDYLQFLYMGVRESDIANVWLIMQISYL